MLPMSVYTRRQFTTAAAGIGVGLFALAPFASRAQESSPSADGQSLGFVSTRLRTVESGEQREAVNEMIFGGFIKEVQALEGYQGYLFADVVDDPARSVSIVVLEDEAQAAAFDDLAADFVASVKEGITPVESEEWSGELLLAASGRREGRGAPPASPGAGPLTQGYVVVRIYESAEETDPRDVMPTISSDFLPVITAIDGFRGYLCYPTEAGFVAIAMFDSEESVEASNEAKTDWVGEHLADYVKEESEVYNAEVRFASLPVLRNA